MEWISVKNRLPEDGQKVLVFRGEFTTVGYFEAGADSEPNVFLLPELEYACNDITHWLPLPEPPK